MAAKDEFTLAAIAQNLRKRAKLCPGNAPAIEIGREGRSCAPPACSEFPQNPPQCRPEEKTADEFFNNIGSNPPCGTAARLS